MSEKQTVPGDLVLQAHAIIEAAMTDNDDWTEESLAQWGIPFPPPLGWKFTAVDFLVQPGRMEPFSPNSYRHGRLRRHHQRPTPPTPFPFGKYKGKAICHCNDREHLEWLILPARWRTHIKALKGQEIGYSKSKKPLRWLEKVCKRYLALGGDLEIAYNCVQRIDNHRGNLKQKKPPQKKGVSLFLAARGFSDPPKRGILS